MNHLKHKNKRSNKKKANRKLFNRSPQSTMSTKTKYFIQKICYKKTASVDMTKHGFIHDNKLFTLNLLLRPLRETLGKICGKHTEDLKEIPKKTSPLRKYATWRKVSKTRFSEVRNKNKKQKVK